MDDTPSPEDTEEQSTVPRSPVRLVTDDDTGWEDQLLRSAPDKQGNTYLLKLTENAAVILANDPAWRGNVYYDTFLQRVNIKPPWATEPCDISDVDTTKIQGWLARYWSLILPWESVNRAIDQVAADHQRSSLLDYLDSLKWDGTARVDTWLATYLGCADELASLAGRWTLIAAVARGVKPGCKHDHVLILEGEQGAGKSRTLAALCPVETWFSDTPLDLGSKDAMQGLQGRWLVELAELDSLLRARSNEATKAFLSSRIDTYRPSYGRRTVQVHRQSILIGTHNPAGGYLTDETGNRRVWPVRTGAIDLPALRRDRDQLWAEAVTLYRSGARWWPEGDEDHHMCRAAQDARRIEPDIWTDAVRIWAATRSEVTIDDVIDSALQIRQQDRTRREQLRVASILLDLGYTHVRTRRPDGTRQWTYRRDIPVPAETDAFPW